MISAALLNLLRCPITGQSLLVADATMLAKANALTGAHNQGQEENCSPLGDSSITAALVSADQKMLFPLRNGIAVLLTEAVIML